MPNHLDKPVVFYDLRIRWVAALNMALVVVGIWLALRFGEGTSLYLPVVFLGLFSLLWIRDLLVGFRLKLLSDGTTLQWQERKKIGSVQLAEVQKILIGAGKSVHRGAYSRTEVVFRLKTGTDLALPPNLASGLHARKWLLLKRLVSHIRTVSNVTVELVDDEDMSLDGWEDGEAAEDPQRPLKPGP